MALESPGGRAAVVKVGFIVEGDCDKIVLESPQFRQWLREECGLELVDPVIDATGSGNLHQANVGLQVRSLRRRCNPDKVVIIADLDPDESVPCITRRKELIGCDGIDLVLVARTAIESWFLADTSAMGRCTGNMNFVEALPEAYEKPWERLRSVILSETGRGPGSRKPVFAKRFVLQHGFDLTRAAAHPACPSAAYAVARLKSLAAT